VACPACAPPRGSTSVEPACGASAQRLRRDKQRCPPLSGEHPTGGSEQDPVACGEPGRAALAAQHPKLLPQHQNLEVLGAITSARKDQQTGQQANGQPEQEEHRGMVRNACSRRESAFPRPTGRRPTAPSGWSAASSRSPATRACAAPSAMAVSHGWDWPRSGASQTPCGPGATSSRRCWTPCNDRGVRVADGHEQGCGVPRRPVPDIGVNRPEACGTNRGCAT
jgi:hypothetical protein